MTQSPELSALQTNTPLPCKEGEVLSQKTYSPFIHYPPSQNKEARALPTTPAVTYPEGGRAAWSVVFGAFCGITASIGIYNTCGIFEAYMSSHLLPQESKSNVGWIFGIYAFVTWFLGVQIGPTFDAIGPTALMVVGSVCVLCGIFAMSACTG